MVRLETPVCEFGVPAVAFDLPGVDGRRWTLAVAPGILPPATLAHPCASQCAGERGLLVMFICNHCPYVKAVIDRIVHDARELLPLGINSVAIMSNDIADYPEDSFENMQKLARDLDFSFPYLLDETQEIAQAYGAVCTPDFFGYNADLTLQYRGRLDASRKEPAPDARRDLFEAMKQIALTGQGPRDQIPSMGCSIKWKNEV